MVCITVGKFSSITQRNQQYNDTRFASIAKKNQHYNDTKASLVKDINILNLYRSDTSIN